MVSVSRQMRIGHWQVWVGCCLRGSELRPEGFSVKSCLAARLSATAL